MDEIFALGREVAAALIARGETLAIAESSTGGLISAAILAVPGASACYRGGGVIYTGEARSALLGLPERSPDWRPSTETYATLLAATARVRLSADWGLGESGAAGPTGNRYGDPAGHSCIALAGPTTIATTLRTGSADRLANMQAFTVASLRLVLETLARQGR
jgi:nicotinamide-nucleotide amidase